MLVDLTPRVCDDPILNIIGTGPTVHLQQGVYQVPHWNPQYLFAEKLEDNDHIGIRRLTSYERSLPECDRETLYSQDIQHYLKQSREETRRMRRLYSQKYKRNWTGEPGTYGGAYGVCDYPAQVLERYPHYADDNIPRAITCVEIRREDQPSAGGFRYHKWGKYIGKQRPRAEYLHDDLHIDSVWTFHVYQLSWAT